MSRDVARRLKIDPPELKQDLSHKLGTYISVGGKNCRAMSHDIARWRAMSHDIAHPSRAHTPLPRVLQALAPAAPLPRRRGRGPTAPRRLSRGRAGSVGRARPSGARAPAAPRREDTLARAYTHSARRGRRGRASLDREARGDPHTAQASCQARGTGGQRPLGLAVTLWSSWGPRVPLPRLTCMPGLSPSSGAPDAVQAERYH